MSFDEKASDKEINWNKLIRKIFVYLIVLFVLTAFHEFFEDVITKTLVNPFLSKFDNESPLINGLFGIVILFSIVETLRLLKNRFYIEWEVLILLGLVAAIYFYYRTGDRFTMIPFKSMPTLKYLDIIFVLTLEVIAVKSLRRIELPSFTGTFVTKANKIFQKLISRLFKFSRRQKTIGESTDVNLKKGFLTENTLVYRNYSGDNQVAHRNRLLERMLEELKSTNSSKDGAFVIGIEGPWGSGKTTFIENFKDKIQSKKNLNSEYVIFTTNPWRIRKDASFQQSFFDDLKKVLSKYASNAKSKLDDYLKIISTGKKKWIYNSWKIPQLSHDEFEDVKKVIKRTNRKFVICLDDLDRLTVDEFIEVFKLVRSTANFDNLIFVLGYDRFSLLSLLENKGDVHTPVNYLSKLVNVEFSLPPFDPDYLFKVFSKKLLQKTEISEEDIINGFKNKRIEPMQDYPDNPPTIEEIINEDENKAIKTSDFLHDIRDINKFINNFTLIYNDINYEINKVDFLVIELVRYKYPKVYNDFYESKDDYLTMNQNNYFNFFTIDNQKLCEYLKKVKYSSQDINILCNAFNLLFLPTDEGGGSNKNNFHVSINRPLAIDRYFYKKLMDINIEENKFTEARESGFEQLKNQIETWVREGKAEDVAERLRLIRNKEFDSKEDLKIILRVKSYLAGKADDGTRNNNYSPFKMEESEFVHMLDERNYVSLNMKENEFLKFADNLFKEAPFPYLFHAEVINHILENNDSYGNNPFVNRNKVMLLEKNFEFVKNYVKEKAFDENLIFLINHSKYYLTEDSNELIIKDSVKEEIKSKICENIDSFINVFIQQTENRSYYRINKILYDYVFEKSFQEVVNKLAFCKERIATTKKTAIEDLIYCFKHLSDDMLEEKSRGFLSLYWEDDINLTAFK